MNGIYITDLDDNQYTSQRVNELIDRYNNRNAELLREEPPATVNQTPHYSYNRNISTDWVLEKDKINDKLILYAKSLNKNLKDMLTHHSLGHNIHDIDYENIADYRSAYNESSAFILKVLSGQYNGKELEAVNDLRNIAIKADADPGTFGSIFAEYLETKDSDQNTQTEDPTLKQKLVAAGYKLDINPEALGFKQGIINYLKKNNIKLVKSPGGLYFAFDSNYTSPISSLNYLNSDWMTEGLPTSSYGYGIFTDANGKIWSGNIANAPTEYQEIIQKYIGDLQTKKGGLYTVYLGYDPASKSQYNELILKMASMTDSKGNPLLNATNYFADVSKLFDSNKTIIAVNHDGQPFQQDQYGNLRLSDNTYLYFKADNGNVVRAPFKMIKGTLAAKKADKNFGNFSSDGFNANETFTPIAVNSGLPGLQEAAEKAGYDNVELYLNSLRKPSESGWSAADYARLVAIAPDLGSLIWSVSDPEPFSNLIGSEALGLSSTIINAGADFVDEGVTAKDAWKNLGLNLWGDVMGIIPGGLSVKVVKNLARILGRNVPLVLGIIRGFNNKEEYEQAFYKLLNKPKDLTVKDYQRLSEIVHLVLRGLKSNIGGARVKPNAEGEKVLASSMPAWRGVKEGVKSKYQSVRVGVANWKNKIKGTKNNTSNLTAAEKGFLAGQLLEIQFPEKRSGGKLDRFGEYLKSHK